MAAVPPERWSSPSPCEGWDARDVVRHVVDVHGMMLKPTGREPSAGPSVDDDPLGAFRGGSRRRGGRPRRPRASPGAEYDGFFGRTKVEATIENFLGFDLVVHGWDLARAAGLDDTMDPAEVVRLAEQAKGLGDNLRQSGVCGPEVPAPPGASRPGAAAVLPGPRPR